MYCVCINSACAREVEHWLTGFQHLLAAGAGCMGLVMNTTLSHLIAHGSCSVCIFIYTFTHMLFWFYWWVGESPTPVLEGKSRRVTRRRIKRRRSLRVQRCSWFDLMEVHEFVKYREWNKQLVDQQWAIDAVAIRFLIINLTDRRY